MMQNQESAKQSRTEYRLQPQHELRTLSLRRQFQRDLERHLVEQERQDRRRRNA